MFGKQKKYTDRKLHAGLGGTQVLEVFFTFASQNPLGFSWDDDQTLI